MNNAERYERRLSKAINEAHRLHAWRWVLLAGFVLATMELAVWCAGYAGRVAVAFHQWRNTYGLVSEAEWARAPMFLSIIFSPLNGGLSPYGMFRTWEVEQIYRLHSVALLVVIVFGGAAAFSLLRVAADRGDRSAGPRRLTPIEAFTSAIPAAFNTCTAGIYVYVLLSIAVYWIEPLRDFFHYFFLWLSEEKSFDVERAAIWIPPVFFVTAWVGWSLWHRRRWRVGRDGASKQCLLRRSFTWGMWMLLPAYALVTLEIVRLRSDFWFSLCRGTAEGWVVTVSPVLVGMYWSLGCMTWLAFRWPVHRRLITSNECIACGYDLRGTIAAGRSSCPECGERVPATASEAVVGVEALPEPALKGRA